jgi:hypothetical protein
VDTPAPQFSANAKGPDRSPSNRGDGARCSSARRHAQFADEAPERARVGLPGARHGLAERMEAPAEEFRRAFFGEQKAKYDILLT